MELFSFIAYEKAKNIGAIMDESYSRCFIRLIYIYRTSYKICIMWGNTHLFIPVKIDVDLLKFL